MANSAAMVRADWRRRTATRRWTTTVVVGLGLAVGCAPGPDTETGPRTVASAVRPATKSLRVSMMALHQMGGVPPGWKLTPPPGNVDVGRQTFVDLGCHSCHEVEGEAFTEDTDGVGPELTGMGAHHPPGYFAEAILNPDAILIEGPGYISEDGRSAMPSYPDLTAQQLGDLVAYIASLKTGGPHAGHVMGGAAAPSRRLRERPPPPEGEAEAFLTQVYDVKPGRLQAFEAWFQGEGAAKFFAYPGLVSIETYVDVAKRGPGVITVFGFKDQESLRRFSGDIREDRPALGIDEFAGPHDHRRSDRPPVYRVPSLSAERPG